MIHGLRLAAACLVLAWAAPPPAVDTFDHDYAAYAQLLARHVRPPRVDYAGLSADRAALDRVIEQFAAPAAGDERAWTRAQRLAFWINAYNAFTLRAIVDHYPIRSGWFTLQPRNSIRQIDGVWTALTVAGRRSHGHPGRHRAHDPAARVPRAAHPLRDQLRLGQLSAAGG